MLGCEQELDNVETAEVVAFWQQSHLIDLAGVAQLAEPWFCKPEVGGSIPSSGSIFKDIK